MDQCMSRLENAQKLQSGLGDQEKAWTDNVAKYSYL
jgi:hypothetical protein